MPAVSKSSVSTGTMKRPARTRGTSRNCTGLTAMVSRASTCSVTRMVPSSVHMAEPARYRGAQETLGVEHGEGARGLVGEPHAGEQAGEQADEDAAHAHEVQLEEKVGEAQGPAHAQARHVGAQRHQAAQVLHPLDEAPAQGFNGLHERGGARGFLRLLGGLGGHGCFLLYVPPLRAQAIAPGPPPRAFRYSRHPGTRSTSDEGVSPERGCRYVPPPFFNPPHREARSTHPWRPNTRSAARSTRSVPGADSRSHTPSSRWWARRSPASAATPATETTPTAPRRAPPTSRRPRPAPALPPPPAPRVPGRAVPPRRRSSSPSRSNWRARTSPTPRATAPRTPIRWIRSSITPPSGWDW